MLLFLLLMFSSLAEAKVLYNDPITGNQELVALREGAELPKGSIVICDEAKGCKIPPGCCEPNAMVAVLDKEGNPVTVVADAGLKALQEKKTADEIAAKAAKQAENDALVLKLKEDTMTFPEAKKLMRIFLHLE